MKNGNKPIAIDLFCGAGGQSLGFQRAGFDIVCAIDNDPINVAIHKKNFPKCNSIEADIGKLTGQKVRDLGKLSNDVEIDVLFGGPPCQGFSLIGKRNKRDPRNKLLRHFCRLVLELKPKYFVIENVPGLLSGTAKKTLQNALRGLSSEYSWKTPIEILNAADYGVPQTRRRVFVLGFLKSAFSPAYPLPTTPKERLTVRDAIRDLYPIGRSITSLKQDSIRIKRGASSAYARNLSDNDGPLSGCKRCGHSEEVVVRFRKTSQGETEQESRLRRLSLSRPSPTLRAGTGRSNGSFTAARPIHPTQPRCITVREAARIHSFPDWFQFHQTQWHGFRQVGNSVPPKLGESVALSIFKAINRNTKGGNA